MYFCYCCCSVVSNSLQPPGLQHTKLLCLSPSPRACSNSCSSSRWCHPTIWASVNPFSTCLQYSPAPGSFLMSQLFTSGGQSNGAPASTSVLPMNVQGWFHLELTGLISFLSKGLSRVFSSTIVQKHPFSDAQPSLHDPALTYIHDYWKKRNFDYMDLCQQWCLCFLICCLGLS